MTNAATGRMLRALLGDRAVPGLNLMKALFDPTLLRPFVTNWNHLARILLIRLQREALVRHDDSLTSLLATLCNYPDVPSKWRSPDLEVPSEPVLSLRLEFEGQRMSFLTTITVFQAPQNISLEELQIEAYFPLDDATEQLCQALAAADP